MDDAGKRDMLQAYRHLRLAKAIIEQLAAKEEHHGYASVGSALDKMTVKVKELVAETKWMAHDPWKGSQMVRGR